MIGAETAARTFPYMAGLPIPEALVALGSKPRRRLLAVLGECPEQLLGLDQSADKSCRRVGISVIEEQNRSRGEFASHLRDGCDPHERIIAEAGRRRSLGAVASDHEAVVPKLMTSSSKRLRERPA